jgi:hypothetical protein
MPAHYLCTALGLKNQNVYAKTIDVGKFQFNIKEEHLQFLV